MWNWNIPTNSRCIPSKGHARKYYNQMLALDRIKKDEFRKVAGPSPSALLTLRQRNLWTEGRANLVLDANNNNSVSPVTQMNEQLSEETINVIAENYHIPVSKRFDPYLQCVKYPTGEKEEIMLEYSDGVVRNASTSEEIVELTKNKFDYRFTQLILEHERGLVYSTTADGTFFIFRLGSHSQNPQSIFLFFDGREFSHFMIHAGRDNYKPFNKFILEVVEKVTEGRGRSKTLKFQVPKHFISRKTQTVLYTRFLVETSLYTVSESKGMSMISSKLKQTILSLPVLNNKSLEELFKGVNLSTQSRLLYPPEDIIPKGSTSITLSQNRRSFSSYHGARNNNKSSDSSIKDHAYVTNRGCVYTLSYPRILCIPGYIVS
jgi:hypothetical protein